MLINADHIDLFIVLGCTKYEAQGSNSGDHNKTQHPADPKSWSIFRYLFLPYNVL